MITDGDVAAWDRQDWDHIVALFAEDGVLHSVTSAPVVGRAAIAERMAILGAGLERRADPVGDAFAEAVRRRPEVLDHLRVVLHSASVLHREVAEELVATIGARYVERYGMTDPRPSQGCRCSARTVRSLQPARPVSWRSRATRCSPATSISRS